jgi:hypothetical protein
MTHRRIALVVLALLLVPETTGPQLIDAGPRPSAGQTATLLPDGRWLLLGGARPSGPVGDAAIWDPRTQTSVPLAAGLHTARAGHAATVLPDGRVLIVGGFGTDGRPTTAVERFDPATGGFEAISPASLPPRAYHTATVLTDGHVLMTGGLGPGGATLSEAELWDPRTDTASVVGASLTTARSRHAATLLPDGAVLLWGGVDASGAALGGGEIYDPVAGRFTAVSALPAGAEPAPDPPRLEASHPPDGATGVPVDAVLALRFSKPLRVETVNATTVMLSGPHGLEAARVVPAEGGRLAFATPEELLTAGAPYTLSINGPTDDAGFLFPPTAIRFTTAPIAESGSNATTSSAASPTAAHGHAHAASQPEQDQPPVELDEWEWQGERRDGKPYSRWQELPPLQAPAGVTALAGQVLRLNGQPLGDVTLRIGEQTTRTDATGRFLLATVPSGYPLLIIHGATANRPGRTYAMFEVGVKVASGRTNALPFTIWLPLIDTEHATPLPVPTTQPIVATTPRIPGLEVHIPAGVVLRSVHTGQPLTALTLTQVPVDRPPFPLPEGTKFFFTPQTHGAEVLRPDGTPNSVGVRFVLPNYDQLVPGVRKDTSGPTAGSEAGTSTARGRSRGPATRSCRIPRSSSCGCRAPSRWGARAPPRPILPRSRGP